MSHKSGRLSTSFARTDRLSCGVPPGPRKSRVCKRDWKNTVSCSLSPGWCEAGKLPDIYCLHVRDNSQCVQTIDITLIFSSMWNYPNYSLIASLCLFLRVGGGLSAGLHPGERWVTGPVCQPQHYPDCRDMRGLRERLQVS